MEWERQRKEQLLSEKAREYEQLGIIKSRASNLKCELESQVGQAYNVHLFSNVNLQFSLWILKYFILNFVIIYESALYYMYNDHFLFLFPFPF